MRISIRSKLASIYLILIIVMIVTAYSTLRISKKFYINETGRNSALLAEEMFKRMDQRLFHLVGQMQIQTKTSYLQEMLALSNDEFTGLNNVEECIQNRDKDWISTPEGTVMPFMLRLIDNQVARHLREIFMDRFEKEYGFKLIREIIVTNRYGANIAISDKTSDYDQSDEEWWQEARNEGLFVDKLAFDESTASYGVDVAVRIDDGRDKFAGVLLAAMDVQGIIREAEVGIHKFSTTQVQIVTSDGKLIYSTMPHRFLDDIKAEPFFQRLTQNGGYFIINGPKSRLYSFAHSKGFKFFRGFGWILVISHQLDDVLAPYHMLQRQIIIVMGLVILFCIVLILALSRMVTSPLKSLTSGIKSLSEGRLDQRVVVNSNDEFGDVASAFNRMLEKRQNAEEALNLTQFAVDRSSDAAFWIMQDGRFAYVNDAACRGLGYTREELLQMSVTEVDPNVTPEIWSKDWLEAKKIGSLNSETQHRTREGKRFPVEVSGSYMRFGGREYICAFARDISDRKRAEEEKARLEAQLQQAQKMESIGTLAGGIAHDFNNILSPIMIHSEMAMADLPHDHSVQYNLKQIFQSGERARDLVKQILTFSRMRQQERSPLRLGPIIKENIKLLRASLPSTIEINQDISVKSDTVLADPTQINQILMNLSTNAAYAMRENGGKLGICLIDEDLDQEAARRFHDLPPGPYLRLTVRDTGHGMDPEVMKKIFEPYFTTKEAGEGTGMGLAVVHGIVKSYNGDITVESERGKGTTFHILLPRIETGISPAKEPLARLPRGNERILFVDDEKTAVDVIQQMLERLGYDVEAWTSSMECLNAFRENPDAYDLVITDMTMPNMTGIELVREILGIRSRIPIILCTGYSDRINEEKARDMGIAAFIMKPIVMREIATIVRKVLDEKGSEEPARIGDKRGI